MVILVSRMWLGIVRRKWVESKINQKEWLRNGRQTTKKKWLRNEMGDRRYKGRQEQIPPRILPVSFQHSRKARPDPHRDFLA